MIDLLDNDRPILTDGGLETSLIYHDGFELPEFAAFDLLRTRNGVEGLAAYYRRYLDIAARRGTDFILESPTWRASRDWGEKLGYSRETLADANREAIRLMHSLRDEYAGRIGKIAVSGCVGPRGDGYVAGELMTNAHARDYHAFQVDVFADEKVDLVTGITMTNVPEAIGLADAAAARDLPCVISFTTETDARLPSGDPLGEAIEAVDRHASARPAYFMVNCAHPTHFAHALEKGGDWTGRIAGLRTNASRLSHEELDACTELDDGDPAELAKQNHALAAHLPSLQVFGGCCGTDERHVDAMAGLVDA